MLNYSHSKKFALYFNVLIPIGTQECVLEKSSNAIVGADVESLTVGLRVSIVTLYFAVAREGGVRWDAGIYNILTYTI